MLLSSLKWNSYISLYPGPRFTLNLSNQNEKCDSKSSWTSAQIEKFVTNQGLKKVVSVSAVWLYGMKKTTIERKSTNGDYWKPN